MLFGNTNVQLNRIPFLRTGLRCHAVIVNEPARQMQLDRQDRIGYNVIAYVATGTKNEFWFSSEQHNTIGNWPALARSSVSNCDGTGAGFAFCGDGMGSKLEDYVGNKLNFHFGHMTIKRNVRPVWLQNGKGSRLELDFYIPMLNVAIEVQGEQHYRFVEFFHGDRAAFDKRKQYDERKRQVCQERGIELVEISNRAQVRDLIKRLEEYAQPSSTLPSIGKAADADFDRVMGGQLHKRTIFTRSKKNLLKRYATTVAHCRYSFPESAEGAYEALLELCKKFGKTEAYAQELIESVPTKAHPSCVNCGSKIRGEYCRNRHCTDSPLYDENWVYSRDGT